MPFRPPQKTDRQYSVLQLTLFDAQQSTWASYEKERFIWVDHAPNRRGGAVGPKIKTPSA